MAGLRERGKSRRRSEIIAAAAALWREHGVDEVSLLRIAAAAEVAPQTIHNLIGTHEALVFAAIDDLLDALDAARNSLPSMRGVDRAVALARISAELFVADGALYRQLVVRIPKAMFGGERFAHDSARLQVDAFLAAQREGDLEAGMDVEAAGRMAFQAYMGALYGWAVRQMDDAGFLATAELAALTPLIACATPSAAATLRSRMHERMAAAMAAPRVA